MAFYNFIYYFFEYLRSPLVNRAAFIGADSGVSLSVIKPCETSLAKIVFKLAFSLMFRYTNV